MTAETDAATPRPRISVIMPVHNAGHYLQESVESVLRQSFTDFELIVIDDCSTDGAADHLADHPDPRVRFFRNEHNLGAAGTRNLAIKQSRGEFVAIQDADDISRPDRLMVSIEVLDSSTDMCVAYGDHVEIDSFGNPLGRTSLPTTHLAASLGLQTSQPFGHGSVLARRDCMIAAGLYRTEFEPAEDYALWAECWKRGCVFGGTGRIHYHYRIHPTGISTTMSNSLTSARTIIAAAVRAVELPSESAAWEAMLSAERAGESSQPRLLAAKNLLKVSGFHASVTRSTALVAVFKSAGRRCLRALIADSLRAAARRVRKKLPRGQNDG